MNICRDCKHSRRGQAIDLRPVRHRPDWLGDPPPPPLSRLQGGGYICSVRDRGLSRTPVDPVDGSGGYLQGPDCRDLNPSGECMDYRRGLRSVNPVGIGMVFAFAALLFAFVVQWVGR